MVYRYNWYRKAFQSKLQSLYQIPEEKVQSLFANRGKWKVDSFRCPLKFVLDYLSDLFQRRLVYKKTNINRFTISAYYEPLNGFPFGQSPLVFSLLSCVFSHRPPSQGTRLFR